MTIEKKKLGFGGQWVDGTPIGRHVDSDGDEVLIDLAFLEAVVTNFENTKHLHQPPAVIGHPKSDAPAFGYVTALRVKDGRLERQFSEVNPEFEEIVKTGAYKKRSDAFYLDSRTAPGGLVPALRHVGFLGAQPPAIKGIADIHFSEEGRTVDVEVDTAINFSEEENEMDEKILDKKIGEGISNWFKRTFGGGDRPTTAQFSEEDQKRLREEISKELKVEFSDELKTRDKKIEELTKTVESQSGSSTHAANVEFVESRMKAGVIPSALKDRYVNLFDKAATSSDKKVTVIEFAEDGKTEKKIERALVDELKELLNTQPPFVTFGEQYNKLQATADPSKLEDREQKKTMRDAMGVKDEKK